jgi:hypothetical protein
MAPPLLPATLSANVVLRNFGAADACMTMAPPLSKPPTADELPHINQSANQIASHILGCCIVLGESATDEIRRRRIRQVDSTSVIEAGVVADLDVLECRFRLVSGIDATAKAFGKVARNPTSNECWLGHTCSCM